MNFTDAIFFTIQGMPALGRHRDVTKSLSHCSVIGVIGFLARLIS